jgi:hypothetical protein
MIPISGDYVILTFEAWRKHRHAGNPDLAARRQKSVLVGA